MAGLVPAIHVFLIQPRTWMPGTRPGHDDSQGDPDMKREDLTEKLLDIKREKEWTWKYICEQIGGYSEVLIVGAILGKMKLTQPPAANAGGLPAKIRLTKPQAANAGELFGLSKSETAMLNEIPMRAENVQMPPQDPP